MCDVKTKSEDHREPQFMKTVCIIKIIIFALKPALLACISSLNN